MNFTRDCLIKSGRCSPYYIDTHTLHTLDTHTYIHNRPKLNKYAQKSIERKNDANKFSESEALSIYIITEKLNCRMKIIYETDIYGFYGKPDFIIKLGKLLYIMVSTTQAINIKNEFDQRDADRLIKKKILGLSICYKNLECLINDDIDISKVVVRPVLHILSPCESHSQMCVAACEKIQIDPEIKIIISNLFC